VAGDVLDVELADGRRAHIRPLGPADRDGYARAVAALSPLSRYLRFASPKTSLSDRELDYFTNVDGVRHVALVAVTEDDSTGLGAARYVITDEAPRTAEVALAVADEWQGQGLGGAMLGQLIRHAREAGVEVLTAMTLLENHGSQGLLRSLGFVRASQEGATADYRLELR
jgi:RimJ/RimL family protein N-acetyltransferase